MGGVYHSAPSTVRSSHRRHSTEAKGGALSGFGSFDFAIPWRRVGYERAEQFGRGFANLLNCMIESRLIGLRRFAEAAELSHKLNCGCANLFFASRWFEVVQGFDVATHKLRPRE